MKDINDILLNGEEVLWSGAPDPDLVKSLAPYWRRKLVHFLWIVGFGGVAVLLYFVGRDLTAEGFVQILIGILIVFFALGVILATVAFFDFKDRAISYQHDLYAITGRRLIVMNTERNSTHSVFPNSVCYLTNNANNKHATLAVYIGYGEDDCLLLHGLPDADKVEKMIAEKFSIKEG